MGFRPAPYIYNIEEHWICWILLTSQGIKKDREKGSETKTETEKAQKGFSLSSLTPSHNLIYQWNHSYFCGEQLRSTSHSFSSRRWKFSPLYENRRSERFKCFTPVMNIVMPFPDSPMIRTCSRNWVYYWQSLWYLQDYYNCRKLHCWSFGPFPGYPTFNYGRKLRHKSLTILANLGQLWRSILISQAPYGTCV